MKKILCLSFVVLLITNLPYKIPLFLSVAKTNPNAIYSFYVLEIVEHSSSYYVIDNAGLGSVVRCKAKDSSSVKEKLNKISGESISFLGSLETAMSLLNRYNAEVIKTEWLENSIYNVYLNAKIFSNFIFMGQEKVNLQICYNNGIITMGSPIILGDY